MLLLLLLLRLVLSQVLVILLFGRRLLLMSRRNISLSSGWREDGDRPWYRRFRLGWMRLIVRSLLLHQMAPDLGRCRRVFLQIRRGHRSTVIVMSRRRLLLLLHVILNWRWSGLDRVDVRLLLLLIIMRLL